MDELEIINRDRAAAGLPPLQAPQAQAPQQMGRGEDAARSFASGTADAIQSSLGAMGDFGQGVGSAVQWGAEQFGISPETAKIIGGGARSMIPLGNLPGSETFQPISDYAQHEPQYFTGDVAKRAGELTPSLVIPGGSLGSKLGSLAGAAVMGPGARKLAEQNETTKPYADYADIAGSLLGSFAPSIVKSAVTPHPGKPDHLAMARELEKEGVDLTAGQKTGDEALHYKESQTGGGAYRDIQNRQRDQYTAALLREAGIEGSSAGTPKVFKNAHKTLGAEFDRLEKYGINPDTKLFEDLVDFKDRYQAWTASNYQVRGIENSVDDVIAKAQQGIPIDGKWMKELGTDLRREMRKARVSDPGKAETIGDLIEVLDDAVERTIANVSPEDAGAFRDVRLKYRNLLTLEEAAANNASGQISPAGITAATKKMETRPGYSRGFGPFNNMARLGDQLMREPPNSGTASRLGGMGIDTPTLIGSAGGTLIGALLGSPSAGAAGGALLGKTAKVVSDKALMSPPMQAYLANQLMTGFDTSGTTARAAANALLAGQNRRKSK